MRLRPFICLVWTCGVALASGCSEDAEPTREEPGSVADMGPSADMPAASDAAPDLETPQDMEAQDMAPPALTYDAFVQASYGQLREAGCRMAFGCPTQDDDTMPRRMGRYPDLATCIASDAPIDELEPEISAGVAAGRIVFDADEALRCLATGRAILDAASDCGAYRRLIRSEANHARCVGALRGAVAVGGRCVEDADCADRGGCVASDDPAVCYGTCAAPTACPQGCGPDERCAFDEALGESACVPLVGPGGACAHSGECADERICDGGVCVEPHSVAQGERCDNRLACADGTSCALGSDVCLPAQIIPSGSPCRTPASDSHCGPGEVCAGLMAAQSPFFDGTCQPALKQGQRCVNTYECEGGLRCDGASRRMDAEGTCQPVSALGGPCLSALDCADLVACRSGVCAAAEVCETL